jgi:hypothetical protein
MVQVAQARHHRDRLRCPHGMILRGSTDGETKTDRETKKKRETQQGTHSRQQFHTELLLK